PTGAHHPRSRDGRRREGRIAGRCGDNRCPWPGGCLLAFCAKRRGELRVAARLARRARVAHGNEPWLAKRLAEEFGRHRGSTVVGPERHEPRYPGNTCRGTSDGAHTGWGRRSASGLLGSVDLACGRAVRMTYEILNREEIGSEEIKLIRKGLRFRVICTPRLKLQVAAQSVRREFRAPEVAWRAFDFVVASERFWHAPLRRSVRA